MLREFKPTNQELNNLQNNLNPVVPNEELDNYLNEIISSPNYNRNFSNLQKNRSKILWTELGNYQDHVIDKKKRRPNMNPVSYSSLSNKNEVEQVKQNVNMDTMTPMSKSLKLGNFKHTPQDKKYDMDKFRKE